MSGYRETPRDPVSREQWIGLGVMAAGLVLVVLFATAEIGDAHWFRAAPGNRLTGLLPSFALLVLSGSLLFQAGMPDSSFRPARRSIVARRRLLRICGWAGTLLCLGLILLAAFFGGP